MPNTKTATKRRGSGGSPTLGPSQKVPRVVEKTTNANSSNENSALEQLKKLSTIVADSADFEGIKEFSPTDSTTNPTLVLQAVSNPKYKHVLEEAVKEAQEALKGKPTDAIIDEAVDRVLVGFGLKLLDIVPGLVSTEIAADLSFDQKASVERAKKIIELYKAKGASKDRILIKVAGTWEGIQAAKQLKQEGINCNITLLFSLCQEVFEASNNKALNSCDAVPAVAAAVVVAAAVFAAAAVVVAAAAVAAAVIVAAAVVVVAAAAADQYLSAVAAADAGAYLVSPFVGRILDWHKKQNPDATFSGAEDPGVKSVTQIYNYFKHFGIKTTVMAASFRNIDEIVHLAGCDKLTIAPKLLEELHKSTAEVTTKLSVQNAKKQQMQKLVLDEKKFRWMLNEDAMATEKLSEGIRNFASDVIKLKAVIKELL
ncbi:hypothetical protein Emed_003807 [Eimeria media]